MIVYLATNKINDKQYVGITKKTLEERIQKHLISKNGIFPLALRKYGLQSFEFIIIDMATDYSVLQEKEKYWINFYHCKVPNGYNLTDGGDGSSGFKHTSASREKMSKSRKGRKVWNKDKTGIYSKETLEKMSDGHRGRKHGPMSEEQKCKISNAKIGKPRPDLVGNAFARGRSLSKEARDKISSSLIGNKRAAGNTNKRGVAVSEETRAKMREARRRRKESATI